LAWRAALASLNGDPLPRRTRAHARTHARTACTDARTYTYTDVACRRRSSWGRGEEIGGHRCILLEQYDEIPRGTREPPPLSHARASERETGGWGGRGGGGRATRRKILVSGACLRCCCTVTVKRREGSYSAAIEEKYRHTPFTRTHVPARTRARDKLALAWARALSLSLSLSLFRARVSETGYRNWACSIKGVKKGRSERVLGSCTPTL